MKNEIKTTFEFLREDFYLPGYMALSNPDYGKDWATFDFNVKEPPVARGDLTYYFTPRGLHICVSQAGYALVEKMASEGGLEDMSIDFLRKLFLQGRIKIVELYQRFRKELVLSKSIPGKVKVERLRLGKMPLLKLSFGFDNDSVKGNLVSVIAHQPTHQLNSDLMRNPI